MIQVDELLFLTTGKDEKDIALMYEDMCDKETIFREACKNYIRYSIPDDADGDDPYGCDITVENHNSVGEVWMTSNIIAIYVDENHNLMFCVEDYGDYDELMQIVKQLSES